MRRVATSLLVFVSGLTLVAPAAAADPSTSTTSAPDAAARASAAPFCRSTDRLLDAMAHAPDPRKLNSVKGRRTLRALHHDAPSQLAADTSLVVDSFTYLSHHGAHTLSKRRDTRTNDAMFRIAIYGATHCKQARIQRLAQGLMQRRIARAEGSKPSTTSTTAPR